MLGLNIEFSIDEVGVIDLDLCCNTGRMLMLLSFFKIEDGDCWTVGDFISGKNG